MDSGRDQRPWLMKSPNIQQNLSLSTTVVKKQYNDDYKTSRIEKDLLAIVQNLPTATPKIHIAQGD